MFQNNLLAGKKILITGGATGLGKSMGQRFLELGASLCICGRREDVLHRLLRNFVKPPAARSRPFPATCATTR